MKKNFPSLCLKNFFGLFGLFLLKRVKKNPFLVQKSGGKFFPGGVRKHELGVGNYRQSGRKRFSSLIKFRVKASAFFSEFISQRRFLLQKGGVVVHFFNVC